MIVEEKSNMLLLEFYHGEDFMSQLDELLKTYKISQCVIRGSGFASMVEYGLIDVVEPIFLKKHRVEELMTISTLNAFKNKDKSIATFTGMTRDSTAHIGRIMNLTVANSFNVIIEIIQTE